MKNDYSEEIERRLRNIRGDERLTDDERDALLELHEQIREHNRNSSTKNQIGGTRIECYLSYGHRLVRNTDMLATLDPETGEESVEAVGKWIDENYDNGYTIDNYVGALRAWGRFLAPDARDDKHPERFEAVELGNVEDDQPAPKPALVLLWSDVVKLLDAAEDKRAGIRTTAVIALLWASGMRPMSEFWELTYGQIDDRGDHLLVSVESDSKTFSRTIRIDVGVPYIRRWMEQGHPATDTEVGPQADTHLWTPLSDDRLLNYAQIRKSVKRVREETDLTKPCNPEHFRKSRASVLANSHWVTQRDLEKHFGWVRSSRVAAHYIAVFESKSRKHIAKADGADVDLDDEMEPIIPVWCESCNHQTPRHRETCLWCGADTLADLNRSPRIESSPVADGDETGLLDLIVDGEVDADALRALDRLEPVIRRRDDLFDRLDSYIAHAEKLEA